MKKYLSVLLLVFVAVSVFVMVLRERNAARMVPEAPVAEATVENKAVLKDAVVAFYFHAKQRCYTCNTLEKYAKEALESNFPEEMSNKTLAFQSVDVTEPANQHYIQDYQLSAQAVVLQKVKNGEVVASKKLDKIWELVRDEAAYKAYIKDSTQEFLKEKS